MTPLQLMQYYANLLILQYLQKPKAYATVSAIASQAIMPQTSVQTLAFSGVAASGSFQLSWTPFGYNQVTGTTAAINWNDAASAIQTKLQALTGLSSATVAGSIAAGLTVTFTGVVPVASLLVVASNNLQTSAPANITITVAETDVPLPLAVSNGFNINTLFGATAIGAQLNIIAKYVGVARIGNLSTGQVILSDADFLSLIQFGALKNSAGSDLGSIQSLLHQFFPGGVLVFDYQNMQMSYLISSSVGSQSLAQLLVAENLLFRPMGVSLSSVIYAPIITTFFGFRTYQLPAVNSSPFNNYTSYNMAYPWLSYAYRL